MERSDAPWTADEVTSLNGFQHSGVMHPFTSHGGLILVATPSGWICPCGCDYSQTWAHKPMADSTWVEQRDLLRSLGFR